MCVTDTKEYIKAMPKPWWGYDEQAETISVCLESREGGEYISFEPAKLAICGLCEGKGRTELGSCIRCESRRVVPVITNKEIINHLLSEAEYIESKEEMYFNEIALGV